MVLLCIPAPRYASLPACPFTENTATAFCCLSFNWLPHCLLCILTAGKRTKFEFSLEQQCGMNTQLQTVCLENWDFCNGYICTVSPRIENEKASIIMFSIFVACGGGCSLFCLCRLSSQRRGTSAVGSIAICSSHISDHIMWRGKHLAAVCTTICTASVNGVFSGMSECYSKIHCRSW